MLQRPAADEIAPFYHRYLDLVPDGDLVAHLQARGNRTATGFGALSDQQRRHRYAPGKWSVQELLGHLCDCERIMTYRALRFARGDHTALPGFEENDYVAAAGFEQRPLQSLVDEFAAVRRASITFVASLDATAAMRQGVANGNPVSVRALAWVIAGHELHHLGVLRERYGVAI